MTKGLNFLPTCNKVDIARLKLQLEQFCRMLHLKWGFRNNKRDITLNPFKTKSTFNPRNKDATVEIYLRSLEEKCLKIKIMKGKFNNLTKGERSALCSLKNDKTVAIKGAGKRSAFVVWEKEDYIRETEVFVSFRIILWPWPLNSNKWVSTKVWSYYTKKCYLKSYLNLIGKNAA